MGGRGTFPNVACIYLRDIAKLHAVIRAGRKVPFYPACRLPSLSPDSPSEAPVSGLVGPAPSASTQAQLPHPLSHVSFLNDLFARAQIPRLWSRRPTPLARYSGRIPPAPRDRPHGVLPGCHMMSQIFPASFSRREFPVRTSGDQGGRGLPGGMGLMHQTMGRRADCQEVKNVRTARRTLLGFEPRVAALSSVRLRQNIPCSLSVRAHRFAPMESNLHSAFHTAHMHRLHSWFPGRDSQQEPAVLGHNKEITFILLKGRRGFWQALPKAWGILVQTNEPG